MEDKERKIMNILVETNQERIEEEMLRPRVEMVTDEFEAWIASKREEHEGAYPHIHFGVGYN